MRFLFIGPPLVGHVKPMIAVSTELSQRGHDVAWAGHAEILRPLLPEGARLFELQDDLSREALDEHHRKWLDLRGVAELKFFWEQFVVPLGERMYDGVAAVIAEFKPDVVVNDQQALAGAVASMKAGIPWTTSACTSSELVNPLGLMPKVAEWVWEQMAGFQRQHGIDPPVDLRFSPDLLMVFTSRELVGGTHEFPPHYLLCGPAISLPASQPEFPWDWLVPDKDLVLASLGTLNGAAGQRFYQALLDAYPTPDDNVQIVLVAPEGLVETSAPHVLIRNYVPQVELLKRAKAAITHSGHNTVAEALFYGVPLVVAPIRNDQPIVAGQVAESGAGVRVNFVRARSADLRTALEAVLREPRYAAAARAIGDSFVAAGGVTAAADRLEQVGG